MKKFELTILGSNSAMPANGRWPTAQVLTVGNESILIDCGEGAQIRMTQYKVKRSKINYVLISHLHGDHIYGLMGFLGSLSHLSRKQPLTVFGPIGIREFIETNQRLSESYLSFELNIVELIYDKDTLIVDGKNISISCFPVNHRIATFGYLIREKVREKNILKEKIEEFGLEISEILEIKEGKDLVRAHLRVPNAELTVAQAKSRSYAYCADTTVEGWSNKHLRNIDLMYFETTYLHELVELAHERGHSTAKEAGQLAALLEIDQLVIGHYSSRYRDVDPLLQEAKAEFEHTIRGYDGLILNI